jgi:hypothetical protein
MSVTDNIGRWKGSQITPDGSVKGNFQISAAEDKILAKIKDGTIRYMSIAHTLGEKQFCTICNEKIPGNSGCPNRHILGRQYEGKTAAIGFVNPRLLHVSIVQNPADLGCAVVNTLLAEKVQNLSAVILDSSTQYASVVAELRGVRDELDKLKRLKVPKPEGIVAVPDESRKPQKRKTFLSVL